MYVFKVDSIGKINIESIFEIEIKSILVWHIKIVANHINAHLIVNDLLLTGVYGMETTIQSSN
jgi:hypothetical protein